MNLGPQHRTIIMENKDSLKGIRVILPNSIYSHLIPFMGQLIKVESSWYLVSMEGQIIYLGKLF